MKLIKPEVALRAAPQSRGTARSRARGAAIEKALTPYILLKCGHYTTRQEIESNSLWQTKKGRFYCCNCGKWVDQDVPAKPKTRSEDTSGDQGEFPF